MLVNRGMGFYYVGVGLEGFTLKKAIRSDEMEIRLACPNDAAALFEMNERFNGECGTTKELLADSIANNSQEAVFIATVDGEAAGFCCLQLLKSMCYRSCYAEITELFVEEAYRQQGARGGQTLTNPRGLPTQCPICQRDE